MTGYSICRFATERAVEARCTMEDGGLPPNHILFTINKVIEGDIKNHYAATANCTAEKANLALAHQIYHKCLKRLIQHFGQHNLIVGEALARWGKNFVDNFKERAGIDKLSQALDIFKQNLPSDHLMVYKCAHWLHFAVQMNTLYNEYSDEDFSNGPKPMSDDFKKMLEIEEDYFILEEATRDMYGSEHASLGYLYLIISRFFTDISKWKGWEHKIEKRNEYREKYRTWKNMREDKYQREIADERTKEKFDNYGPVFYPPFPLVYLAPKPYYYEYLRRGIKLLVKYR